MIFKKTPSPNYSDRNGDIRFIILHYTEMPFQDALDKLCDKESQVSCHYLIREDGNIFQLVEDQYKAWHAGKSNWGKLDRINDYSIGIELDNIGNSEFSSPQIQSCITLCKSLKQKYKIPNKNILGHSDIAPDRKIDPGVFFPWKILAQSNIGLWYDNDINPITYKASDILQIQNKLKEFGYKIEQTGIWDLQTNFVIRAFQAHFLPNKIIEYGNDFYRSNTSKYYWDKDCEEILNNLLLLL
jgi:N-acetylmuramoyl-L-alanine amidase